MKFLQKKDLLSLPPAKVGQVVYGIIGEELGDADPYARLKHLTNEKAQAYEPHLQNLINNSQDQFATALKLAVLGNSVDFAAHTPVDIDGELAHVNQVSVNIDDSKHLIADLANARRILYIGDNSGEIIFDKLFIQQIQRCFPAIQVVFSVRAKPIINDATIEDAIAGGLDKIARIVANSQSPGVLLTESSPEFVAEFLGADVIISKGQGNYEALSNPNLPTKAHVYFLLRAKCTLMADIFQIPMGSLIVSQFQ